MLAKCRKMASKNVGNILVCFTYARLMTKEHIGANNQYCCYSVYQLLNLPEICLKVVFLGNLHTWVFQCEDYQLSITARNVVPQIPTRPSGYCYGLIITIGSTITGVDTSTIFLHRQPLDKIFSFKLELILGFHPFRHWSDIKLKQNISLIKWQLNLPSSDKYKYIIDVHMQIHNGCANTT